ncbi:MAG TPA: maleylpyruvate isomerase N-terminal domain-containing protein [Candidatus Limnocylindrales bacterium]
MYLDGLSFLEEERDTWRPFEALAGLPDPVLERPVPAAHGWSGRDLMAHLLVWLEFALQAARELAVGEASRTIDAVSAEWRSDGDAMNARLLAEQAGRPTAELRRRFEELPGELRGYLTVVPETRWVKHPEHLRFFLAQTTEHYAEHEADLEAVLGAGRP